MKVKTKLFLIPILAMAIAATAFFGFANYSTPETVSATGPSSSPIFLYTGTDQTINIWAWNADDGTHNLTGAEFPGAEMKKLGNGWYGFNIDTSSYSAKKVIFSYWNGSSRDQTVTFDYDFEDNIYKDVEFDNSTSTYTKGTVAELYAADSAFASEAQYNMFVANTWYLIGKIKGVANWTDSTLVMNATGSNIAEWYQVRLNAGDEIKAVHGNDMPSYTAKGRKYSDTSAYSTCKNNEDGNNLVVTYTGVYNVYLYDNYGYYYISIAPCTVQSTYYKTSSNTKADDSSKRYLLLVTAFDLGATGDAQRIGYDVTIGGNTTPYYTNTYYDSVCGNDVATIYGTPFGWVGVDLPTYKLIVTEIEIGVGAQEITIQAKVKNGEGNDILVGLETTCTIAAM